MMIIKHCSHVCFRDNDPGLEYDLCSGSLITNHHVLTSAECLLTLTNREMLLDSLSEDKIRPEYSKAECIYVTMENLDKEQMLEKFYYSVEHLHIHDQAFTDINDYNYNIGKCLDSMIDTKFPLHRIQQTVDCFSYTGIVGPFGFYHDIEANLYATLVIQGL